MMPTVRGVIAFDVRQIDDERVVNVREHRLRAEAGSAASYVGEMPRLAGYDAFVARPDALRSLAVTVK